MYNFHIDSRRHRKEPRQSLHFYSGSKDFSFTAEQTLTGLESGTYKLTGYIQGDTAGDADSDFYFYVVADGQTYTAPVTLDGYVAWHEGTIEGISVTDGTVTIGISGTNAAGGWGTIDAISLERWILNEKMMHGICSEFGIKFACFLQPSLLNKMYKTDEEREALLLHTVQETVDGAKRNKELRDDISNLLSGQEWFYDLRTVFDDCRETVFFDFCHVLGEKNKIIAQAIWDRLDLEQMQR